MAAAACSSSSSAPPCALLVRYPQPYDASPKLTLTLCAPGLSPSPLTFSRSPDDPLAATLKRMVMKLPGQKSKNKKKAKKEDAAASAASNPSNPSTPAPEFSLRTAEATTLDADVLSTHAAFSQAAELVLNHPPLRLPIVANPPTCLRLELPKYPLVGLPILPIAQLEFADDSADDAPALAEAGDAASASARGSAAAVAWEWRRHPAAEPDGAGELVASTALYTPTAADTGCVLSVTVTANPYLPPVTASTAPPAPKKGAAALTAAHLVCAAPMHPTQQQHAELGALRTDADHLRILTYNILLDAFCDNAWALENLYPYLAPDLAHAHYRRQLTLRDIAHADPDVMCLQEVDGSAFESFLQPLLRRRGYTTLYANKISTQPFGQTISFRADKFELVESQILDLTTAWRGHPAAEHLCRHDPLLAGKLDSTTTVAQVVLLRCKGAAAAGRMLAVANLHLYSHPLAPHIRLIQADLVAAAMAQLRAQGAATVFCGDLNSNSESGAVEYFLAQHIAVGHPEWAEGTTFTSTSSETQAERETNWHAAISGREVVELRAFYARLDRLERGQVDLDKELLEQLPQETALAVQEQLGVGPGGLGAASYATFFRAMVLVKRHSLAAFAGVCEGWRRAAAADADDALPIQRPVCTFADGEYGAFELRHDLPLRPVFPDAVATYAAGRTVHPDALDHIFFDSEQLAVTRRFPLPDPTDLRDGIPSACFGSDHVPLVCDMAWR